MVPFLCFSPGRSGTEAFCRSTNTFTRVRLSGFQFLTTAKTGAREFGAIGTESSPRDCAVKGVEVGEQRVDDSSARTSLTSVVAFPNIRSLGWILPLAAFAMELTKMRRRVARRGN